MIKIDTVILKGNLKPIGASSCGPCLGNVQPNELTRIAMVRKPTVNTSITIKVNSSLPKVGNQCCVTHLQRTYLKCSKRREGIAIEKVYNDGSNL